MSLDTSPEPSCWRPAATLAGSRARLVREAPGSSTWGPPSPEPALGPMSLPSPPWEADPTSAPDSKCRHIQGHCSRPGQSEAKEGENPEPRTPLRQTASSRDPKALAPFQRASWTLSHCKASPKRPIWRKKCEAPAPARRPPAVAPPLLQARWPFGRSAWHTPLNARPAPARPAWKGGNVSFTFLTLST